MQNGYIKLHRKMLDNPIFKKPNVSHYWFYCLMKANHTTKKIIWNQKEKIIEKGSFLTGRKKASEATGLTEQMVRGAQKTLINCGMLIKDIEKSTSKSTYLTICNYREYQDKQPANNQQTTSKQPASNQQVTTNKNDKNDKNDKKEDIKIYSRAKNSTTTQPFENRQYPYEEIIGYLNEKADTHFKYTTKAYQTLVRARINEGVTLEDFKKVIDNRTTKWINDVKMNQYLRPSTLFGNRFDEYLNMKEKSIGKIDPRFDCLKEVQEV